VRPGDRRPAGRLAYKILIPGRGGAERLLQAWNYQTGEVRTLTDPWIADAFDVTLAVDQL
jgi:hypothetical protein